MNLPVLSILDKDFFKSSILDVSVECIANSATQGVELIVMEQIAEAFGMNLWELERFIAANITFDAEPLEFFVAHPCLGIKWAMDIISATELIEALDIALPGGKER